MFFLRAGTHAHYWATNRQAVRKGVLLVSSILFYAYWFPPYVILLLAIVLIGFVFGSLLYQRLRESRALMFLAVALPLAILGYFKYRNYTFQLLSEALTGLGYGFDPTLDTIYLPLGISFITFQLLGYIIDVKRGIIPPEKNFLDLLLFKAYFPQLIAGPICRGAELLPQLKVVQAWSTPRFLNGLTILAVGFFLKVVFADNIAPFVNQVYADPSDAKPVDALFSSLGFGFQILADFWGYSTMAVGMSQMFGIWIPVNFDLPYLATSIREFWRRWHITLSNWLRDYLYIPLGGSRGGKLATGRNLFITMLLGGLWHGAATNFVIWGAIHGAVLTAEHFVARRLPKGRVFRAISLPLGWLYTMLIVFVAWVFFRAATTADALAIFERIGAVRGADFNAAPYRIAFLVGVFCILAVPLHRVIRNGLTASLHPAVSLAVTFWMFFLGVMMASPDPVPFIYFQF